MSTLIEPIKADLGLSDSVHRVPDRLLAGFLLRDGGFAAGHARRPRESPHHDRARARGLVGHDHALRIRAELLAAAARAHRRRGRRGGRYAAVGLAALGLLLAAPPGARAVGVFGGCLARIHDGIERGLCERCVGVESRVLRARRARSAGGGAGRGHHPRARARPARRGGARSHRARSNHGRGDHARDSDGHAEILARPTGAAAYVAWRHGVTRSGPGD